MSERKWTPGPWECSVSDEKDWGAFVFGPRTTEVGGFEVPDAHLIAAAPDLYEALERLSDLICDLEKFDETGHVLKAINASDQALAKARGETQ